MCHSFYIINCLNFGQDVFKKIAKQFAVYFFNAISEGARVRLIYMKSETKIKLLPV